MLGTSILLIAVAFTAKDDLLGALLGYWIGFMYTQWLYRDTLRSVDDEVAYAIKRMRRSFFARLGMVTLVVTAVARFQTGWLLYLALGIALGLIVSMILYVNQIVRGGKG